MMKSMQYFLKALLSFFDFRIFSRKKAVAADDQLPTYLQLQGGEHNCAPIAIAKIMPEIPLERIIQGFSDCCDKWPYGGVTNKEFNITLRNLKVFERFEYCDSAGMKIKDFLAQKDGIFILLLHGHFTVVERGILRDHYLYVHVRKGKVYCSWRLLVD